MNNNKITVKKNKKIKDMTPEEYKAYKKEYYEKYKENKKKQTENNITRKLKGKTKKAYKKRKEMERATNYEGRKFDEYKDTSILMNPLKTGIASFTFEGLDIYCQLNTEIKISGSNKRKRAELNFSILALPNVNNSNSFLKIKNFHNIDITNKLKELTSKNYGEILRPLSTNFFKKEMKKWTTEYFMHFCIHNSHRHKHDAFNIIYNVLDKNYADKKDFHMSYFKDLLKNKDFNDFKEKNKPRKKKNRRIKK